MRLNRDRGLARIADRKPVELLKTAADHWLEGDEHREAVEAALTKLGAPHTIQQITIADAGGVYHFYFSGSVVVAQDRIDRLPNLGE